MEQLGRGPRCLRVALVRDGRIEQERLCEGQDAVWLGGSEWSTLVVPDRPRHALFERTRDGYVLRLAPGMAARVVTDGGARRIEGPASLPLGAAARGRVEIDGAGVLFQMTVPPPPTPRPQLPSAVRGGFFAQIDWLFSAITTASFLAFCAFVVTLDSMDWPIAQQTIVPESAARFIMDEPAPPPPDEPVTRDVVEDEALPEERVVADADVPTDTTPGPTERRPGPRDRQPTLADADEIRRAALLQIGTLLGDGSGEAIDGLRQGAPTTDLADLLAQVDGAEHAANDATTFRPRDGCGGTGGEACRDRDVSEIHLARGEDTGPVDVGPVTETEIIPVVEVDPVPEPEGPGFIDAAQVSARVRGRLRAIRACYEHRLGPHPDLRGKITAELTIQPAGNVTGVRAVENTTGSTSLATCVEDSLRTIRFREGPEGGPVTFRYPFVFATQR